MFNFKIYKAYLESSKPRVVLLMIFTSFIGMLLADPLHLNFKILILGNLGIALMSLSAGSINQLLDQRIDSIMQRTKSRPLVSGVLKTKNVVLYASIMQLKSIILGKARYLTDYQVCLLSSLLITLWPISPNGNFFNNWMIIVYSLSIGFYLQSFNKKKKQQIIFFLK